MSEAATVEHGPHSDHHELGFVRTYIFSTDHKMIGRQFMFASIFMLIIGGLLAMMIRWELAWPESAVPFTSWISEPFMYPADEDSAAGAIEGLSETLGEPYPGAKFAESLSTTASAHMDPAFYNSLFTMHATIMIFFVVMPFMVGGFGNFLIPLMIGAGDMAFPLLNLLSFWTAVPATIMILWSFFVEGGAAAGGWTMYATLSADPTLSGVDTGADLWVISLLILGVSSLMGAINYITTIVNMRAPGMTWFRLPLVIWSLFITAILLLLALPVLTAALGMLLFDRTMGTSFFMPGGGRRAYPVATFVLVFRASRGLYTSTSRYGRHIRHSLNVLAKANFRLQGNGVFHDRTCFPILDRLGTPYVCQWHEPRTRYRLYADNYGNRRAFRYKNV